MSIKLFGICLTDIKNIPFNWNVYNYLLCFGLLFFYLGLSMMFTVVVKEGFVLFAANFMWFLLDFWVISGSRKICVNKVKTFENINKLLLFFWIDINDTFLFWDIFLLFGIFFCLFLFDSPLLSCLYNVKKITKKLYLNIFPLSYKITFRFLSIILKQKLYVFYKPLNWNLIL